MPEIQPEIDLSDPSHRFVEKWGECREVMENGGNPEWPNVLGCLTCSPPILFSSDDSPAAGRFLK
jgi:hypothetical protein